VGRKLLARTNLRHCATEVTEAELMAQGSADAVAVAADYRRTFGGVFPDVVTSWSIRSSLAQRYCSGHLMLQVRDRWPDWPCSLLVGLV
jgi:hypothetical protein